MGPVKLGASSQGLSPASLSVQFLLGLLTVYPEDQIPTRQGLGCFPIPLDSVRFRLDNIKLSTMVNKRQVV